MATAVHPYPVRWIDRWQLANGKTVTVRPILPQDDLLGRRFVASQLTPRSRYQRFMFGMRELPDSVSRYLTQIDYHDHFALIAESFDGGLHQQLGDARYARPEKQSTSAEFALAVADDWQGLGLGRRLLQTTIAAARHNGLDELYGDVLRDNTPMLQLAQACGFSVHRHPDDARLLRLQVTLGTTGINQIVAAPGVSPAVALRPAINAMPRAPHRASACAWDRLRRQIRAGGW